MMTREYAAAQIDMNRVIIPMLRDRHAASVVGQLIDAELQSKLTVCAVAVYVDIVSVGLLFNLH